MNRLSASDSALAVLPENALLEEVEAIVTNPSLDADVAVIGGGPGGYTAAIRAAQLGASVVVIEKAQVGGTCLNWGCIPTKALLAGVEVLDTVRRAKEFGVNIAGEITFDWAKMQSRKDRIVSQLVKGVELLLKELNVRIIHGSGRLLNPTTVEVDTGSGKEVLRVGNIILATGSTPVSLSTPGLSGEGVWNSDDILQMARPPKSLLVIGAGAVGLEFGDICATLGAKVTVVELMPQVLPATDTEVANELEKSLTKKGIRVYTSSKALQAERVEGGFRVALQTPKGDQTVEVENILVAVGRRPNLESLGLEKAGIHIERNRVTVNDKMQTNTAGVYAIGDIVPGPQLAHKASAEGIMAAENCMGKLSRMDYRAIPACVYTYPEVASVGMSQEAAQDAGRETHIGRFPFRVLGKALAIGDRTGFVKIVADAKYGEVLGVHIIGPSATDLIGEAALAMKMEASVEDIARTVHPHPTLTEALMEAALDAQGESISQLSG
ncbi:MAG: dihydrolipoyl dehydrogenase [Armatimonadetes bacterium]|nr:dihydrolipoyl dehydrogenase [Armatimonadota bacterium]